ncbi:SDR family oxidoreductase [Duganella sp. Root198D2]|uniref:SDR family oxidoreductase n=1 Tax=Duganella sp. Root198D2 TaxID=1736489 RepID=UPI000710BE73|nr:SDR family oxidoreductase [Duganella sp. Root198D2]KRB97233.1 NADH dehydrogenase [Duganella sp. Root198D2]
MRVLLTGATGFIGSHVAAALLARGHEVIAAGRHPSRDPRMGFVPADFAHDTEKAAWVARLKGVDIVVNAAGIFRSHGDTSFAAVHDAAPRALFAACAGAGVHYVVQVSALGADAGARTAFHASKKAADDALAASPLAGCIVQPSLVYGANGASARMFRMLAAMPVGVQLGSAQQMVQPVHIDDVTAAIVTLVEQGAMAHRGARGGMGNEVRRLALVGPDAMPFVAYLRALRIAMGLGAWRLPVLRLPDWLARGLAQVGEVLPGSPLDRDALDMLARGNTADAAPLAALLGRQPRAVRDFIVQPEATRHQAQLDWLLPLLRLSIAAVWIWTAIVSAGLYPVADSHTLLIRTGVPPMLAPLMLYGASALDLAFGAATLAWPRRNRRWLWLAQIALIAFYSIVIAWRLPEFLLHPYGPISKNLPMLAALWMLYELEKPSWNT